MQETHWLSLPGDPADRRTYARAMGNFVLASQSIYNFTDTTTYIIGVALDLSNRPRLLSQLAPLITHIRSVRPDDTGKNQKSSDTLPPELAAPPLRVACPKAYADSFKARSADIERALRADRKIAFKEFCKLSFLALDHLCEENPGLMRRIVRAWPPRYFGL